MKKYLLILAMFLGCFLSTSVAQVPTPIRSTGTLPATCKGGTTTTPTDSIVLITASVGTLNICDTNSNGWAALMYNVMTTLGDTIYGGASGTPTRLAGPTSGNSPYILTSTPASSAATAPVWGLAGVPMDVESGATFTVQNDTQTTPDRAKLVQTTNATTSTAVTVPAPGSTGMTNSFVFVHCNTGSVIATDTPSSSTINGNSTSKLVGAVAGHNPECQFWYNDGTNWWGPEILPTDANGRLAAEGFGALTGDVTNTAGTYATTVGKINGTAFPTSATVIGSNGSAQPIAATTTGSGNVVLGTGPTITLANGSGLPMNGVVSPSGAIAEIQDGNNPLIISSAQTTAGQVAVTLGEHTAATSTGTPYQVEVDTLAGSTATPLEVVNSLTGSQILPTLFIAPTWNTSGIADAALAITITNTACASGCFAIDIKLGATAFFQISTQSGTPSTAASTGPKISLGGSAPQIVTPGTTPYLNMNTLVKGTKNTCSIISPVSLTGTTAPVCSWTLPNSAVTWRWDCKGTYSLSAGTNPALTLQMNAAQAPTSETGNARIGTLTASSTIAQVDHTSSNTVATTSGAQTIMADGTTGLTTLTSAPWSTDGTITAVATSGTFSISALLSGTLSPTGTINVGSGCYIE